MEPTVKHPVKQSQAKFYITKELSENFYCNGDFCIGYDREI
jgi:hypothetical protein